ncbi:NIPSNAP family protein [Arthrobacter sp. 92]|uniref:NIPSNAP family protein n=1 Tax=Arthrobacter sp. 92 TaxID=3418175 RepID=UPI003CFBF17B
MMTFELRTYTAAPDKMAALLLRFQNHTRALFHEHGIHDIGYWISTDSPDVLIYLVRHEGDPESNWEAFKNDAEWVAARAASMANGELITSITSTYMTATDFSPLRS